MWNWHFLKPKYIHIQCPKTYLSEVYAFIVSVMYKQKLLFVPHQQALLRWVPCFSVQGSIPLPQPLLGRETASGFLREQTSKQCLTSWTLQPRQWHFPSTCIAAESLPWITSIFFPSLLGFAKAKKIQQQPASSLSPKPCPHHGASLEASLAPTLSPWLTQLLLGPPNLSNKAGFRDLQRLSLYRQWNALKAPHPGRTTRGGTLLCSIQEFQGQSSWTLAACAETKLHVCTKHQCSFIWACWVRCAIVCTPRALWWPVAAGSGTSPAAHADMEHSPHLGCQWAGDRRLNLCHRALATSVSAWRSGADDAVHKCLSRKMAPDRREHVHLGNKIKTRFGRWK